MIFSHAYARRFLRRERDTMSHAPRDGDGVEWHVMLQVAVKTPATATVRTFKVERA